MYYRQASGFSNVADELALETLLKPEEDWWLPAERPTGRLPWGALGSEGPHRVVWGPWFER
jgi:hypothetical protein